MMAGHASFFNDDCISPSMLVFFTSWILDILFIMSASIILWLLTPSHLSALRSSVIYKKAPGFSKFPMFCFFPPLFSVLHWFPVLPIKSLMRKTCLLFTNLTLPTKCCESRDCLWFMYYDVPSAKHSTCHILRTQLTYVEWNYNMYFRYMIDF